LRAYDRLLDDGQRFDNVLDLGCGTAVLAMSAARMGAAHVLASDIDPVAVEVALANVKANGLVGRVACVESIGFDSPVLRAGTPFDLIFANILKGPLIELAPDMAAHLAPGGRAILSGLLVEQADEIVEVYQGQGLALETREDLGEWSALTLRRLS
jgi:ribosomal protein L11 methyltransferase